MGFSLDKFIPQNKVTATMILSLQAQRVLNAVVIHKNVSTLGKSTSYQVPAIVDVTTGDYDGSDITWVDGTDTSKTITIDQSKYFATVVDKVDDAKAAENVLNLLAQSGVSALANAEDIFLADKMASQAGITDAAIGTDATPLVVSDTNVTDYFATLKRLLDENNVPQSGRFAVVPPFVASAIATANIVVSSTTDEQARANGFVQNFLGFSIYMSNNLVKTNSVTAVKVLAGVKEATYEVDTLRDIEFTSIEKRFANGAKGLHVYGAEVLQPNALAVSVVSNA
jgi:hypothetical protein